MENMEFSISISFSISYQYPILVPPTSAVTAFTLKERSQFFLLQINILFQFSPILKKNLKTKFHVLFSGSAGVQF